MQKLLADYRDFRNAGSGSGACGAKTVVKGGSEPPIFDAQRLTPNSEGSSFRVMNPLGQVHQHCTGSPEVHAHPCACFVGALVLGPLAVILSELSRSAASVHLAGSFEARS